MTREDMVLPTDISKFTSSAYLGFKEMAQRADSNDDFRWYLRRKRNG